MLEYRLRWEAKSDRVNYISLREESAVILAPKRLVAPPFVLLHCLAAGFLISHIASAQSPGRAQPPAPQIAAPAKSTSSLDPPNFAVNVGSEESYVQPVNPVLSKAVFIENLGQFDSRVRYQVKIGACLRDSRICP